MFESKNVARDVSDLMVDIGRQLDASLSGVREGCSADEYKAYLAVVARMLGDMLLDVMNPIYARHPELKPAELD